MNKQKRYVIVEVGEPKTGWCKFLDFSNELNPLCALTNRTAHCEECTKGYTEEELQHKVAVGICGDDMKGCNRCPCYNHPTCAMCLEDEGYMEKAKSVVSLLLPLEEQNA